MSDKFTDELREILIRVDERTERIDQRIQRIEADAQYLERQTEKQVSEIHAELSEIDGRVRRNTMILSALTFGISTLIGVVATKAAAIWAWIR